ncbi:hypothetical protein F4680DRAFT_11482 [Xylaria scruposa]|nr:hypothetical protein F4680DRAFT_11482 [Xylaria scruposa]
MSIVLLRLLGIICLLWQHDSTVDIRSSCYRLRLYDNADHNIMVALVVNSMPSQNLRKGIAILLLRLGPDIAVWAIVHYWAFANEVSRVPFRPYSWAFIMRLANATPLLSSPRASHQPRSIRGGTRRQDTYLIASWRAKFLFFTAFCYCLVSFMHPIHFLRCLLGQGTRKNNCTGLFRCKASLGDVLLYLDETNL